MAFPIDDIIGQGMARGGARPNLFHAIVTYSGINTEEIKFACKAGTLPATTIGNVPVPYMGHKYNVPGDISLGGTIDLTIILDEGLNIRKQFERWMESIRTADSNRASNPAYHQLMGTVMLQNFTKDGAADHFVTLKHAWPQNIGDIALAWDSNDQIMEMNVTIQYTWHEYPKV